MFFHGYLSPANNEIVARMSMIPARRGFMMQQVLQRGWGGPARKPVVCITDGSGDFKMF